jgi:hypothetical protein
MNTCGKNRAKAFSSWKRFGLIDVDQKDVEGDEIVGREWWASGVVIPTNHATSFCSLNAVRQIAWSFAGINLERNFILLNSGWKHNQYNQTVKRMVVWANVVTPVM